MEKFTSLIKVHRSRHVKRFDLKVQEDLDSSTLQKIIPMETVMYYGMMQKSLFLQSPCIWYYRVCMAQLGRAKFRGTI